MDLWLNDNQNRYLVQFAEKFCPSDKGSISDPMAFQERRLNIGGRGSGGGLLVRDPADLKS